MHSLRAILDAIGSPVTTTGAEEREVKALRHDSRRVERGDLYVAVNGRDDRGLEFVADAVERGAVAVIADDAGRLPLELLRERDVTLIVVRDARRAMARAAHALAGWPAHRTRVYGVTGTNGKTTVSWVLRQLLEGCGVRTGLIGTLGAAVEGDPVPTGFTTPESPELASLLAGMVESGAEAVAMEVSSHALALGRVDALRFAGAVHTNLTQDHLDFHDSMENYREAKKRLFDALDADAPAVVNIDDPSGEEMVRNTYAPVYRYGSGGGADARIADVALDTRGARWSLTLGSTLGGRTLTLSTPLLGAFNVWNVTGALALALAAGYDREALVDGVATLRAVPGRMESYPLPTGATAVVDYAHTPDALDSVLRSLREISGRGEITVLFGCGGDRDRSKRPLMGEAAARGADRLIVTSDNPRSEDPERIIDDVVGGVPADADLRRESDRARAIAIALDGAGRGDVVLIAGKGHEDYQIIGGERRHFSDSEQVRAWIAEHNGEVTA